MRARIRPSRDHVATDERAFALDSITATTAGRFFRDSMKVLPTLAAVVVLFCALGAWPSPATAAAAPAAGSNQSEDEIIGRGVKLRKAGDDQSARDLFRQAYDRFHSPRAAGQLGLAEQALGRWEEAEAHLREALQSPEDPWVKKNFETLTQDIQIVKSHVGRIEVTGQPEGAEIMVNGRSVGRLPLGGPVITSAGEVDVEARAGGYQPLVRKLALVGGQYQRIVVRLEKVELPAAPSGGGTSSTATTAAGSSSAALARPIDAARTMGDGGARSLGGESPPGGGEPGADATPGPLWTVGKWGSLSLAGVGLAVGITSTIIRANKLTEFKTTHGGCLDMNGRAVDQQGAPVAACQDLLNSYKSMRTWQIVGFVAAGVFAATSLALFLAEPSPSASGQAVATGPRIICGPTNDLTGAICMLSM